MRWVRTITLLLAWLMFAMSMSSPALAGVWRWTQLQQYWGEIKSVRIDKCGRRPGRCEGAVVLARREGGEVVLAIRPGTWIKRGERLVLIEELQVGDAVHVQAFEIEGQPGLQATTIDVSTPR
ncbi:MAG TPA: hypothetical protein VNP04_16315 [Alphaproteobacteria bacterium]|nr:hypothetical protein [Alphaproteobacteria bacterium]